MKVALVDIDGCAVQDGKLNQTMVDILRKGGYDQVFLFTQRNTFLQVAQITRAYAMADTIPNIDQVITTVDAVEQLSGAIGKPVAVSTSVDQFFGQPTAYYQETLAPFEKAVKEEALRARTKSKSMDDFNAKQFNPQIEADTERMRKQLGINDPRVNMANLIPEGKVNQYRFLINNLPISSNDAIEVDYFDDSMRNLDEFLGEDLPVKPNLYLVSGQYAAPLATFDSKMAPHGREDELAVVQTKARYTDRGISRENATLLAKYGSELNKTIDAISHGLPEKEEEKAHRRMKDLAAVTAFLKGSELEKTDMARVRAFALQEQDTKLLEIAYTKEYGLAKAALIAQCTLKYDSELNKTTSEPDMEAIQVLKHTIDVLKSSENQPPPLDHQAFHKLSGLLPNADLSPIQENVTQSTKETCQHYKKRFHQTLQSADAPAAPDSDIKPSN
jgi:hypothetical protein